MADQAKSSQPLRAGSKAREAGANLDPQRSLSRQLEIEHALLEAVLRQMPAGVIIAEAPSGRVVLANEEVTRLWSRPFRADDISQYSRWQAFHVPDMRPYKAEEWPTARSVRNGEVVAEEEMYLLRDDGSCTTVSVNAAPIRDGEGKVVAAVAILADVTAQRDAEEERRMLSRAVEQSASTVLITDAQGNIEYVNPKFTSLTGYSPEEVMGKNPRVFKSGATPPEEYRRLWETITAGGEWRGEMLNRKKNGELYWEFASISAIRNVDGVITHFLAVKEDITERKRAEEFREEYLSLTSHDLRNPLTIVVGQAEWIKHRLEQKGLDQEARGADSLLKNARRMSTLINDLVNSAQIEAGRLELHTQAVDPFQLVSEIVDRLGPTEDRARIRVEVPEYVPLVLADRDQIERAIVNLIGNALKYSPSDSPVTLTITQRGDRAVVSVEDRGVGIAAEDLPYVFDRYYRAKSGRTVAGSGLGLYITRLIVLAHGGAVRVESKPGLGSIFFLSLPLAL